VSYGRAFRAAVFLHNRLGCLGPLARMTADRFELLLSQRLILRDLDGFIDRRIRRIHGRRVADLLHELLARRVETVETALEGLRLQYPGYAEEIERRFIRRTALGSRSGNTTTMRGDGLIGAELHSALPGHRPRRPRPRAAPGSTWLSRRPNSSASSRSSPAWTTPLLKQLSRALRARYVNAGDVILRKDAVVRSVYFVASGAVEFDSAGQALAARDGARCSASSRS
jgi:monovalent cation:H+ antiporter, CPA1 family